MPVVITALQSSGLAKAWLVLCFARYKLWPNLENGKKNFNSTSTIELRNVMLDAKEVKNTGRRLGRRYSAQTTVGHRHTS